MAAVILVSVVVVNLVAIAADLQAGAARRRAAGRRRFPLGLAIAGSAVTVIVSSLGLLGISGTAVGTS